MSGISAACQPARTDLLANTTRNQHSLNTIGSSLETRAVQQWSLRKAKELGLMSSEGNFHPGGNKLENKQRLLAAEVDGKLIEFMEP